MSRDPARSHGVIAVLTDGPADLPVARLAVDVAAHAGTRLLAAVLLPHPSLTADAAPAAQVARRMRDEADAVGARIAPTAAARDVAVTPLPLLLPVGIPGWSGHRLRRVLRLLARRSGAGLVVLPDRPLLGMAPGQLARALPSAVVVADPGDRSARSSG